MRSVKTGLAWVRSRVGIFSLVLAAGLFTPQTAVADNAVTRWMDLTLRAVAAQNVGTPNAGRLYAMVSVAMYDAVNGIDAAESFGRQHALVPPAGAPAGGAREVAAAAAAYRVLVDPQFGLSAARVAELDDALDAEVAAAGGLGDPRVVAGNDWGLYVGGQVVSARAADGTQATETVPAGSGCGTFRAGWDARWRHMTTFGVDDPKKLPVSPAPPALTKKRYAQAFDDVRTCGSNSPTLDLLCSDPTTPLERAEISSFWQAEARTVRETGTWFLALAAIVDRQGTSASLSDTARLYALAGMAIADAVRSSWETKHASSAWRPFHAIREAACDGNPHTLADPTWEPRIFPAIGGSPEWNSGTATFAGAASSVIQRFYEEGLPAGPFCFETYQPGPSGATLVNAFGPPNATRCYDSPSAAADEAGRSRIFQGIHFQFSNEDGRGNGEDIGKYVAKKRLRSLGDDEDVGSE